MSRKSWLPVAGLVLLCLAAGFGGFALYRHWQGPALPDIRPDVQLTDLDGKPHRLSEWDGKLLLINFWATWCGPCLHEIPMLVLAQKDFGPRGLQILGPAMDEAAVVRAFNRQMAMNYPLFAGDTEIANAMDTLGSQLGALPFSVLIAPDGQIFHRQQGPLSRDELQDLIEPHLKPQPGAQ